MTPDLSLPNVGGYRYRALRLTDPMQHGADVYALQTALVAELELELDGVLGKETSRRIADYQRAHYGLTVDGIAGGVTQRDIAWRIGRRLGVSYSLPTGVPYGHLERESSFLLGNYTAVYTEGTAKGSRDEGVVQRNTRFASSLEAFTVPESIEVLCRRVHDYHAKYVSWGVADPRAWRLACGSWNAPAWTDTLARGGTLTDEQLAHITEYINDVTAYAALD